MFLKPHNLEGDHIQKQKKFVAFLPQKLEPPTNDVQGQLQVRGCWNGRWMGFAQFRFTLTNHFPFTSWAAAACRCIFVFAAYHLMIRSRVSA